MRGYVWPSLAEACVKVQGASEGSDHKLPVLRFAADTGRRARQGRTCRPHDDSDPDADPAVITGYKAARNRPLTRGQKLSNKALAAVRAPVEHGFAHLKNWRVLGKVRIDPKWATTLVRALLVLTNNEVAR